MYVTPSTRLEVLCVRWSRTWRPNVRHFEIEVMYLLVFGTFYGVELGGQLLYPRRVHVHVRVRVGIVVQLYDNSNMTVKFLWIDLNVWLLNF